MTQTISSSTLSDQELISNAQAGDRDAFAELTNRNYNRMLRVATRMLANGLDAEDVVQQAFIAAFQNMDKFRGDSQFSTWMTRITMNECMSFLRKRKRQSVSLEDSGLDRVEGIQPAFTAQRADPESMVIDSQTKRLVHESLKQVKPVYRQAMVLRLLEDLSVEEIAGRLQMPVNTVKVHLFRGRKSMRAFLETRLQVSAA